jgi:ATP-binding cassette subfamily F protein 3
MLKVENISKSYGTQKLFDSVSFVINRGEKVGLVGRNGHGKTTLFRIITGMDHPDSGEIILPREYTLGYVTQNMTFTEKSVIEECCLGLPSHQRDEVWKAEKVLTGLGYPIEDQKRNPAEFSDGYRVRLNLAKTLVSEPDLLLLDEPTNYLDVVSIRWLTRFLNRWNGEMMVITHDRSFMDAVTTHVIGIHRQKTKKVEGTTGKLYDQILKEEEIHEKTRINDEKKRKETELFISRFRAKARLAGMVQSRIKALEKQKQLDKLDTIKTLDFAFSYKSFEAKTLMSTDNLSFAYDKKGRKLIDDLKITIGKHDRIAVIGKNGKGKTTLLKLLSERLKPDTGEIHRHSNSVIGFYDQTDVKDLNNNRTIEEELMDSTTDRQKARNIAGAMMFEGDDALKRIEVLSGGERSRVVMGKILARDANLILLDEPTNHLDMESCDALMAAIDDFAGAVVFVTHNELFLHTLANRFIIFMEKGITLFEGTYQDFLNKIGWEDETAQQSANTNGGDDTSVVNKRELRKKRAEIQNRKSAELKPLQERTLELEEQINLKEIRMEGLTGEMIAASEGGSGERIQELSRELHTLKGAIDDLYDELETTIHQLEEKQKGFDEELSSLG